MGLLTSLVRYESEKSGRILGVADPSGQKYSPEYRAEMARFVGQRTDAMAQVARNGSCTDAGLDALIARFAELDREHQIVPIEEAFPERRQWIREVVDFYADLFNTREQEYDDAARAMGKGMYVLHMALIAGAERAYFAKTGQLKPHEDKNPVNDASILAAMQAVRDVETASFFPELHNI